MRCVLPERLNSMAIIDGCCDFLGQKVRVGFSRAALQQRGETVASPAGIPRVSPIFAASEVHERNDALGLLAMIPLLVTGKADSRMKTNATTMRCGDESSSRVDYRVRTQVLEGNIERAKVKRTIVTAEASAFSVPYHSRCMLLEMGHI